MLGEPKDVMYKMVDDAIKWLPENKPRYLMGVGNPIDLIECAIRGIDMYDCVLPTRVARHGAVMTSVGRININNEKFKYDYTPLDPNCTCYTCKIILKLMFDIYINVMKYLEKHYYLFIMLISY